MADDDGTVLCWRERVDGTVNNKHFKTNLTIVAFYVIYSLTPTAKETVELIPHLHLTFHYLWQLSFTPECVAVPGYRQRKHPVALFPRQKPMTLVTPKFAPYDNFV